MQLQLGQILDPKDTKRPRNSIATVKSLQQNGVSEAKALYCEGGILHRWSAHNTTYGVANYLGHPPNPSQTPGHPPTLAKYKEQAHPPLLRR